HKIRTRNRSVNKRRTVGRGKFRAPENFLQRPGDIARSSGRRIVTCITDKEGTFITGDGLIEAFMKRGRWTHKFKIPSYIPKVTCKFFGALCNVFLVISG